MPKYSCAECGAAVSRKGKKCKSCAQKALWDGAYRQRQAQIMTQKWKEGTYGERVVYPPCPDCGKPKSRGCQKCLACSRKDSVALWQDAERRKRSAENTRRMWEDGVYAQFDWGGENNPNWKGGVSKESALIRTSAEYQEWREKVFERDSWTCRECGAKREVGSVVLHAHHVKEFATHPEMRLDVSNGLTLCEPCHMALHGLNCWARERQFGEKNPNHKLTWEQVGEIRRRNAQGEQYKALAQEFGIARAYVGQIVHGKSWSRGDPNE